MTIQEEETQHYKRVADRPAGWRKPPPGIPRQCWNIWSFRMKRRLTKDEAFSSENRLRNPALRPYYCKNCQAYHLGHQSIKPSVKIKRHEDLMIELGMRACYHLLMEDTETAIRRRCQTAAEKRGEFGPVK